MKFKNLRQYGELARFFFKYGTGDLVKNAGLSDALGEMGEDDESDSSKTGDSHDAAPEEMVRDLIALGPAFIKLGQLLSTRPDLLPAPYIEALSELQDNIEPFDFAAVEEIVTEELGQRISKAFESFDSEPIASASLGQVHRAKLRDGTEVVVKIRRPGIRKKVYEELEVLETTARFLQKNTQVGRQLEIENLVLYFRRSLLRELNYLKEAEHMLVLRENLKEFDLIVVPAPIEDYTTDKVLTMELIKGQKITGISPLRKLDIDGDKLVDQLFAAYLKQIVIDGFMHADPHPGNVHLTDDNRIALLDMGMVEYIGEETREKYLKILLYIGDAKGDKLARLLIAMSRTTETSDPRRFQEEIDRLVQENRHMTMANLRTGNLIFELIRTAGRNGYVLPIGLSMLGKVLLNLDRVGMVIAPEFNPREAIQRHTLELMQKYTRQNLGSHNFLTSLLEGKEFLEHLPARLNKLLENAAENRLRIHVDALDENKLVDGFQKIADRITMGLIIAALLVSAAMLMRVPSSFSLFGYPGLAILAFLAALGGAIVMAVQIFFKDR